MRPPPHTSWSVCHLLATMHEIATLLLVVLNLISLFTSYFVSVLKLTLPCLLHSALSLSQTIITLVTKLLIYIHDPPEKFQRLHYYYVDWTYTVRAKFARDKKIDDHIFIALICCLLHKHKDSSNLHAWLCELLSLPKNCTLVDRFDTNQRSAVATTNPRVSFMPS